jgi:response regulator RpfG family c-di-GMP phosphodiesterase
LAKARTLFNDLLDSSLILVDEWERVPFKERNELLEKCDGSTLLKCLVDLGLLTSFQEERIREGRLFGLVLGNYRVLDHLGTGGMGIVYKAEHLLLRRQVAIKVLEPWRGQDFITLTRFLSEMRAVARLDHPNIVAALDAGRLASSDPDTPPLYYLVMEFVAGEDLESYVLKHGPLAPSFACELIAQVADGLGEANRHQLVHRDLKPSNVMITPENQAKILDFGLVHHLRGGITAPEVTLGTLDFMAPEQVSNASNVDIRADIYALGGTMFWALTGKRPFATEGGINESLLQRLVLKAPSVRAQRPEISSELDAVVARMLAHDSQDRYPTPQAVCRALAPFLRNDTQEARRGEQALGLARPSAPRSRPARILIVDDDPPIRGLCLHVLQAQGYHCDQAEDGADALRQVQAEPYDLLLVDVDMPGMNGPALCNALRAAPPCPNLKIIMFSGRVSSEEMDKMVMAGADDYIAKPFSLTQLQARVQSALRTKQAQDRLDKLNVELATVNRELQDSLGCRGTEQVRVRDALVLALAECVEYRDGETSQHLLRLQAYSRCLAEEAGRHPKFAGQITPEFIDTLHCCVPLHDLGKTRLPDHILLKPDTLTPDERLQVQAHTVIGADTLQDVTRRYGGSLSFLQMAVLIARHHHERYDGTGYPDHLAGDAIPLAARLVAIGDVYDALRSRRVYKPALSHAAAMQLILENSSAQFDPALVDAFRNCAGRFDQIFREMPD